MGIKSLSTIFRKEEELMKVPDIPTIVEEEYLERESNINHARPKKEIDVVDDYFDWININFHKINDDDEVGGGADQNLDEEAELNHRFKFRDCLMMPHGEGYQGSYFENSSTCMVEEDRLFGIKKEAECAALEEEEEDDDKKKLSLNLSLNYQGVLDAWSDRTLWADDSSFLSANNAYRGEVPMIEKERKRREASVLRYKEKRQTRLFSKKIRYQVRKLNADNRPRLKGRFVKRVAEKILK